MQVSKDFEIAVRPELRPEQLQRYYRDNETSGAGYDLEAVERIIDNTSLMIGAFVGDRLVGLARAMFDGVSADIVEMSMALECQGEDLEFFSGSLIEKDPTGLAIEMGRALVQELGKMGANFISASVARDCEEPLYERLHFKDTGSAVFCIDKRPSFIQAKECA